MPKRLEEREIFKTKLFIIKDVTLQFGKKKVSRQILKKPDSVLIVPLTDDGNLILINEYMTATDEYQLDVPGGRIDDNENPKKTAKRELEEEIGYKASKIDKLGMFTMSPGYLTQKTHAFLTKVLAKGKRGGDEDEELELVEYPFADFETLIKKGKISEARAIAALYMAKNFLENEKKKK